MPIIEDVDLDAFAHQSQRDQDRILPMPTDREVDSLLLKLGQQFVKRVTHEAVQRWRSAGGEAVRWSKRLNSMLKQLGLYGGADGTDDVVVCLAN